MKKLLIASDCFLPRWDGVARFLSEIIPKLTDDFEITVVAPEFPGKKVAIKEVKIARIPVKDLTVGDFQPAKIKPLKIKKLVKESDIVFAQTIGSIGAAAMYYAESYKKPLVSYIHSIEWELVPKSIDKYKGIIGFITRQFARKMYNKCSLLLVPSKDTLDKLVENKIKLPKKIIHLGVDLDEFYPAEDKAAAKKSAGIDPKNLVIGFVGRVGKEKNLPTLYKAFSLLRKKHKNLKLLVVGGRKEDVDRIDGMMHVPSTNEVVRYYHAIDIFVLPSLTETSSLSTMEAMACGLPVVATNVGFVKDYIKDGRNGYLIPKQNVFALSKKIENLVEKPLLRKEIGEKARQTIKKKFSWEKTVNEIKEALGKF